MPKVRRDPYSCTIVGPAWMHGGTEQHATTLAKFVDAARVKITECLVTNEDLLDRPAATRCPVPVRFCPPHELISRTAAVDCVMIWGIETDLYLARHDTQARIHIAHGASDWTQQMITGSALTTDHVVCVSKHSQDKLAFTTPHSVIQNGIDSSRLTATMTTEESREICGFSPHDWVAGYVGRLADDKGVPQLIRAIALCPPNIKGLVCGYGPERHALEELAETIAPGRVKFLRTDSYLGDVYQTMDCFVMPSQHEGFCLSAAEAMWSGVPIIMTATGLAADDITDARNGMIVTTHADSIADAIYEFSTNRSLANVCAIRAQNLARTKYQARRMAESYTQLIESIVEAKRPDNTSDTIPY